ncbi:MAG: DoxX family protein [Chloroflexi bacterium AL-W]|nr:DoxX family protein [Chloroflexi bacterium AL-N1]NOK67997.1 DoxX family protein [Chloroflexi bacterium AL-N10]NOK73337.1 DoxX family protein [Chloroflexi bacterium AL-N5]NOK83251.1 DoxX family protein [Chloroflexi bacterium AL-W]NOK87668.1 DoxX family protein [Chloroflexi bacterium AL-N15]
MMTIILWILQVLLAVTFAYHGYLKFVPPADLPFLAWLYDIPLGLRIFIGVAEFAAVIGLILPGVMKTYTWLTPLAALGLVINMVGAIIFHIPRGEIVMIQGNIFLLVLAALVAYGRWRIRPLPTQLENTI